MTREALHAVPILPLDEVDDEAVVAHPVDLPLLLAGDLRGQLLELGLPFRRRLDVALLQDPVQILVQAVQQEAQELLRVMLLRAQGGAWLQMDLCGMLLVSGGPQTKSS